MNFLNPLKKLWQSISLLARSPFKPNAGFNEVAPSESLNRFIFASDYLKQKNGTVEVKYGAFMPHKDRLDASIYRTDGLTSDEIWKLGAENVEAKRTDQKKIRGRAEISAQKILSRKLTISPLDDHPKHANIEGWPEEKDKQRSLAAALALESIGSIK
jgi:hypothetical protein